MALLVKKWLEMIVFREERKKIASVEGGEDWMGNDRFVNQNNQTIKNVKLGTSAINKALTFTHCPLHRSTDLVETNILRPFSTILDNTIENSMENSQIYIDFGEVKTGRFFLSKTGTVISQNDTRTSILTPKNIKQVEMTART